MIWLSPTNGTQECSVYFEIRDIDLQYHGDLTTGVIRGVVGDGTREFQGEVFLGHVEYAQILPVWTMSGEIESFPEAIDEPLLLRQLLSEVKLLLQRFGAIRGESSSTGWNPLATTEHRLTRNLAA